jgi:N-methylhydantoinase A
VIVPAFPGALSALGILSSDVVKDYSRTVLWRVSKDVPWKELRREFEALEKNAADDFRRESWRGHPQVVRSVDVRYQGQGYELNIPITKSLLADFEGEHKRRYGYTHPNRAVELVTLRLRARLESPMPHVTAPALGRRPRKVRPSGRFSVQFDGKRLQSNIYAREALIAAKKYAGPAIVTEYSATTIIPPGKRFHVDRAANLIITI